MADSLNELVGKTLLVGIAHVNEKNEISGRSQYFGTIIKADVNGGVIVKRRDTDELEALPPFPERYFPAKKGVYTLQSNGLKVKDPDYTCTWQLFSKPINKN